jgi:hypothetical protein
MVFFIRVPSKPLGLIVFEGLFELYNRSSGLLPDPLKIFFQNILSKYSLKISFQNILLKHPPKTSFQNNFLQTAYSHIIDSYIIDLPFIIYFIYTARETYKSSNSFNIQVNYEVSKNTKQVSSK